MDAQRQNIQNQIVALSRSMASANYHLVPPAIREANRLKMLELEQRLRDL